MTTRGEHSTGTVTLGFGSTHVRVTAPQHDLCWLQEFCLPLFELCSPTLHQASIEVIFEDGEYAARQRQWERLARREYDTFTLDGSFERLSGGEPALGEILVESPKHRVFLLVRSDHREARLIAPTSKSRIRPLLMRILRELATVATLRAGGLPLHASAMSRDEGAAVLPGEKTSGKTTLLVSGLRSGFNFLSNDRVFATRTTAGWTVRGMPTIVKIRSGTLELFPELRRGVEAHPWHWEQTLDEVRSQPRRPSRTAEGVSLSLAQFLHTAGAAAAPCASLKTLLFPEFAGQASPPEVVPLDGFTAFNGLMAAWLRPGGGPWTSEVFDAHREPIDEMQLWTHCAALAGSVPCFRILRNRNPRSAHESAEVLRRSA